MEYTYNNAKNASIDHIFFEFNYGYHPWVFYKENLNSCLKSKTVEELFFELQNFIAVYKQNLYHTQKLQKQAYNKRVKLQSYVLSEKI